MSIERTDAGAAITGTVLSRQVVWVFVSVQDSAGAVRSWRSLSIEDQGFRPDHHPSFALDLDIPPTFEGAPLWIEANAYNSIGRKIGSVREPFWSGSVALAHDPIRIKTSLVR